MSNVTHENTAREPGYLSPEFISERAQFYIDRSGKIAVIGCGDDRSVTEESADKISQKYPDALPLREGYASVYGAVAGIAKNVLVAGVAQYGPEFIGRIGGFEGAFSQAAKRMREDETAEALIPALHSAQSNEASDRDFDENAAGAVGCAYAMGIGATSALLIDTNDALIRDIARRDQTRVFGSDEHTDELLRGHQIFLETATDGRGKDFAFGRGAYSASDLDVMILAGSHTSAKNSGLIHSFEMHKVRSTTAANKQNKDFYNQDISIVTAATLRAFAEYNLDPELLMRAYVLDATPVRAVLAASDADPDLNGKLDPRNLPMGVLGNPQTALAELQALAAELRAA